MGWVKTGSTERDMFIIQGPEDFVIDSTNLRLWESVECGLWDQPSKVDNNWESGRRGLSDRFGPR